jgi:hypothetical protein
MNKTRSRFIAAHQISYIAKDAILSFFPVEKLRKAGKKDFQIENSRPAQQDRRTPLYARDKTQPLQPNCLLPKVRASLATNLPHHLSERHLQFPHRLVLLRCGLVVTPAPRPSISERITNSKGPLLADEWHRQLACATDGTLIA